MFDIHDANFNGTLLTSITDPFFKNDEEISNRFLKQGLTSIKYGWWFHPTSKYFKVFDGKIQQLLEGGFIAKLSHSFNLEKFDGSNNSEPEVLTMSDLETGFVVWLIAISVALIVFGLEHLCRFIQSYCDDQ